MGKGRYLTNVLPVAKWCLNSVKAFSFPFYGKGHSQDWWPKLTKDIFYTIWHHTQQLKLRERRRKGNNHGYGVSLPKQPLRGLRSCFPGSSWTTACQWEVNEFLFLLCLKMQLLLCLSNCCYLELWVCHPSIFSQSCGKGNEQAAVWVFGCWLGSAHHSVVAVLQIMQSRQVSGKLLSVQYSAKQMFSPPNKTSSHLHILCTIGITKKYKYKDVILQFTLENVGRKGLLSKGVENTRCFLIYGKAVNIPWWNAYTGRKTLNVTLKQWRQGLLRPQTHFCSFLSPYSLHPPSSVLCPDTRAHTCPISYIFPLRITTAHVTLISLEVNSC